MSDDKPGEPADDRLGPDAKTIINAPKPEKRPLGANEYAMQRPAAARSDGSPATPTDRTIVLGSTQPKSPASATIIGQAPKKRPTMPGINVTPTPAPATVLLASQEPTPSPPTTMPNGTPLPQPLGRATVASSGRARRPSEGPSGIAPRSAWDTPSGISPGGTPGTPDSGDATG